MKTRPLGKNGPQVSEVSLGCMSFAGFYGKTDQAEAFACLDAARDAGIDFLDTSDLYGAGLSETWIGAYQKDRGYRFKIATKGGIVKGAPRGTADNSETYLREHLAASMERLGVDHVELYYVHRREFSRPIEEVAETLDKLRQEGLIGAIGLSEIAPSTLRRAAAVTHVDAVQNEYSLWSRQPDLGLISACEDLGTAFVPFSPLGRGILGDVDLDPAQFGDTDFRRLNPRFQGDNFAANMAYVRAFRAFCAARGWSTAATAVAWTLDQSPVNIPIPGTRSAAHLEELATASDIAFSEDDRRTLAEILPAGWAHGDRYSDAQIVGIERYC